MTPEQPRTQPTGQSPFRREVEQLHGSAIPQEDWVVICETWLNTLWCMGSLDIQPGLAFIARKLGTGAPADGIERRN